MTGELRQNREQIRVIPLELSPMHLPTRCYIPLDQISASIQF
jgi:hypothetical protein